jgi:hypothetical protein
MPGKPKKIAITNFNSQSSRYSLVVKYVLAKDELGVRFPLSAPKNPI